MRLMVFIAGVILAFSVQVSLSADTAVGMNLEFYSTLYRGMDDKIYYSPSGKADLRVDSTGNRNMRAGVSLEYYPLDVSGGSSLESAVFYLKRAWFKASFPAWRLTAGKTRLAWGKGFIFNSGDILFGSLAPFLDFTQSEIRSDTAWLTAFNIPLGSFSFLEGVLMPPNLILSTEEDGSETLSPQTWEKTSGGLRLAGKLGPLGLEGGLFYKGDPKVASDLLGLRPYLAFDFFAGVDWYAAASLALGPDHTRAGGDKVRDTPEEIASTVNISLGFFRQFSAGYDSTLSLRFEALLLPWQNWTARSFDDLLASGGYYGLMLYPEITWTIRSSWSLSLQSLISPIDGSAQITTSAGWNVFQGFTLLGFFVVNAGESKDIFAWDRSPAAGRQAAANGISLTLGARYKY